LPFYSPGNPHPEFFWFVHAAYPDRPIKLIVPYPPGGATDVIGRILAKNLGESLGQQVLVENRGGAGGNIGAEAVAKANPDGYTLLMGAVTSHSTMATLEKGKLRYDLLKDFTPVMIVGSVPLVVVVNPNVPVRTLKGLVDYAKANPDKLNYASSGAGAPQRMGAEIFQKEAGQVNMMVETVPAALPFINAGQLRPLAVTTAKRISMLPDVPTTAESGMPTLEVSSTFGVLAPVGTPMTIVDQLNSAIAKLLLNPEVKEAFLKQGVYAAAPSKPKKSAELLAAEVKRWEKVIREADIKAE
jgi:tripartite-type tricarboxylate transporter receptor subunit TctC